MRQTNFEELLEAGAHFGHMKRKWNPGMAPYIFMERNGIHIIDLHKTIAKIDEAANAIRQIAKSDKKVLFVATKKQAKQIVTDKAIEAGMPYITERWAGGMLTNFQTIRRAVKKMGQIDKMATDGTLDTMSKRERLQISRQREKLELNLGSISDMSRMPAAIFVVDVMKENIAVSEAKKLGIPIFGIVDTNSDPSNIDFVIPCNDDASQAIEIILSIMVDAIKEGRLERKMDKAEAETPETMEVKLERKTRARRTKKKTEDTENAPEAEDKEEEQQSSQEA